MQTSKTFSPKELAPIIGVSQSSIKRWVDAGLIEVTRTAGGHRRILLSEALRFIRKQKMRILRPDLLGLPDLKKLAPEVKVGDLTTESLLHVLETGKASLARGMITAAYLAGRNLAELFDGPISEAMGIIGERWKHDQSGIMQEHASTQILLEAITQVRMLIPPAQPGAPVAIGGAPNGDPYLLPSMMVAAVLADAGYRVVNLGPQTPPQTITVAVDTYQPQMVWIAATSGHAFIDDEETWDALIKDLHEHQIRVAMGGKAAIDRLTVWEDAANVMHTMAELATYAVNVRNERIIKATLTN